MTVSVEIKKVNNVHFDKVTEDILCELEKTRCEFWNLDRQSANFLNALIKINNSKNLCCHLSDFKCSLIFCDKFWYWYLLTAECFEVLT